MRPPITTERRTANAARVHGTCTGSLRVLKIWSPPPGRKCGRGAHVPGDGDVDFHEAQGRTLPRERSPTPGCRQGSTGSPTLPEAGVTTLRLVQPTAFSTPISLARSAMLPAMVLKAMRTATMIAIREAAMVNLSERAKRLPRSLRKESGVPIVAFLSTMSRKWMPERGSSPGPP